MHFNNMVLMIHQDKQHNFSHLYGMDSASLYGLAEMIFQSIHLTPKISLKCNTYDRSLGGTKNSRMKSSHIASDSSQNIVLMTYSAGIVIDARLW
jgi:dTDP-4-dehydrorhamnose reductase